MKWVLILVGITYSLLAPGFTIAQEVWVECEWYYESEDLGGVEIFRVPCISASNDTAVAGFDVIDECVRYQVAFPVSGSYDVSLRSAGLLNQVNELNLVLLTDQGPSRNQTSRVFTMGYGIG
jgi:hypothetical protein